MKRDYIISLYRFIAMLFIYLCHIFQKADVVVRLGEIQLQIALTFNVGVQMFLFLSGYLYGKRTDINISGFLTKAYKKVLLDYYLFVFISIFVLGGIGIFTTNDYIGLLTFSGFPDGFGHLWYISTILFCYLLTPIYIGLYNDTDNKTSLEFYVRVALMIVFIQVFGKCFFESFTPTWLVCFFVGIIFSIVERRKKFDIKFFRAVISIGCICLVIFKLYILDRRVSNPISSGVFKKLSDMLINYEHVFLAIFIFFIVKKLGKKIVNNKYVLCILKWSDKYSYDVYLVHHIFVNSPWACVEYIDNKYIAMATAFVCTIVSAMLLRKISSLVLVIIKKYIYVKK